MEKLKECIICNHKYFNNFIDCKDYFLSKEVFSICECRNCGFKFTNPRPLPDNLPGYYDPNEYLSYTNSKKGFLSSIYQLVKNITIRRKYLAINKLFSTGTILDIGCGTGDFLNYFKKNNWLTYGIEPNKFARDYAIKNYNIDVKQENEINNFSSNHFDVITMWHSLEHVSSLRDLIINITRILKDNGIIVVAVPNCDSWDAKYYKDHWAAYDVPRHLYHFTPKTLGLLFKNYSFKIVNTFPMIFDSFYISLLSEKYISGKTKYFKALANGIKSNFYARKNEKNYSSLIYFLKKE